MNTRLSRQPKHPFSTSCCLILLLACCFIGASSIAAPDESTRKHSLVVVTKGINDEVSNAWTQFANGVAPTEETFVILDGGETFDRVPIIGQLLTPHPSSVKSTNIIRIDNPDDPKNQALLKKIAETPNAKVLVDMNLGLRVSEKSWGPHTEWAGKVARSLAEAHVSKYPDSETLLVGHSAGTEPIASVPLYDADSRRLLFDKRIAVSPRRDSGYPEGTICIFKDGDFYYSPGGRITMDTITRVLGEREAEMLANRGYAVVRVAAPPGPSFEPESGGLVYLADYASKYLAQTLARNVGERFPAHTDPTSIFDQKEKLVLYLPHTEESIELKNTSISTGLEALNKVNTTTRTETPSSGSTEALKDAVKDLTEKEPTPGLGGISLNATARLPVDAAEVAHAGFDAQQRRLYLKMRNGNVVWLPTSDVQVLRQGYEFGYLSDVKPELSISNTFFDTPDGRRIVNLTPPGRQPVYYFGHTEDTLLGLVMYLADQTLGKLTFGSTAAVHSIAEKVPGFRSMPELYPEKYADHPASQRFLGSEARVFTHPSLIELTHTPRGNELEFGNTQFSVEFGKSGPAEAVFASFLESHFHEIANTESGAPFKQLVAYARVLAIFRWIKENKITFEEHGLASEPMALVFTPRDATPFDLPSLNEIAPRAPTMLFGPAGPVKIINRDQKETVVSYANGRPIRVQRYDGGSLEILRDDLGVPVAVRMNGTEEAAFYNDPTLGLVLAANLRVEGGGRSLSVHINDKTVLIPEKRPEETVSLMVARFAIK
ncbi:MAG: hypothetical protein QOF62_2681 [Pyrinomonadaceae bacterium]|jgi:hypothetical protein|nr:hypothetical protein [Pyrinomonadaceae bacterium]